MSVGDPEITVWCDECDEKHTYGLCALAGGGWDDRYLRDQMKRDGWTKDADRDLCETCTRELDNEDEDP